jgi:hypothetical protein
MPAPYVRTIPVTNPDGSLVGGGSGGGASENHLGEVGGKTIRTTVEFTRTTGTTGYHANDAVLPAAGGIVEIPNVGRINAGSGYITEIRCSTNLKSVTPRFRIHLFNASNLTISADGAVWQDLYADIAKRVGYYDMPALSTAADATNSDMSRSMDTSMRLPFVCVAGTSLYYAIETLDAFTPSDSEKFSISLYVEQN